MLQIKDVKLKGNAESLCRAETPLVWVHYCEQEHSASSSEALFGPAAGQGVTVFEMGPVCSPSLNVLTARACLQPAPSTSTPAATSGALPCSWQARGSAQWWVWRNSRAKALCMLQIAAGYHLGSHHCTIARFPWSPFSTEAVGLFPVCPAAQMCLRITGINYPQHDSDRMLPASEHLVVVLHLTVGDFIALCCPTKSNTNSTLSYFAWFSQWNWVYVLFFLECWQFDSYLTATNVPQNSRTLQIWIKRMGHLPPTHSCTMHSHSVGVLHINGFPIEQWFDRLPSSGCLAGKLLDIY